MALVGTIIGVQVLRPQEPITVGVAVVDNAPQVNLRSCAAANCAVVTTLNRGNEVSVTKSYDNGWKAVTIKYTDGTSASGFVNGDFLRPR